MNNVLTLETNSLILRPLELHDAPAIFAYASDPEVAQLTHWQQHTSLDDTLRFIHLNRTNTLWVIIHKKTQTIIGECGLINTTPTSTELHCALSRAHWGKGIAQEASECLINFGFSNLNIQKIYASILAENVRSIRLAQKMGMHQELLLPNHWFSNNTAHDVYLYAITHYQPSLRYNSI